MRKKIVAGNWKMNTTIAEGKLLLDSVITQMPALASNQQVIFCVPFTQLYVANEVLTQTTKQNIFLGAQNCHDKTAGAFTGEISIPMLTELGVHSVIIGHSERRQYFGESNAFLKAKVDALIAANKQILFCCGESLQVRESNTQNEYVTAQLKESLFHLSPETFMQHIVIAYEPIWAIGTGVTASTEQAQEMHASIRQLLAETYSAEMANEITILYGGSCNGSNAKELFACKDVDGGLIGGAALKAELFLPIIQAMTEG